MKLSIITINRNNAAGLRKTIKSVLSQTYRDFEYIIIDGASTDESVDVIRDYESTIKQGGTIQQSTIDFKWISEPDNGIYYAMNKGIEIALGRRIVNADHTSSTNNPLTPNPLTQSPCDYIQILNSGDFLVEERVIERIIPELNGTDIIQGNNIEEVDNHIYRNRGYGKSDIDFFDVMKGFFLHQAVFCKKKLFEDYGIFDETYKMAADTKFFMNCLGVHNASFRYVDVDIANYDMNGVSAEQSGKWAELRVEEDNRLRHELYSDRQLRFFEENEKKVKFYNQLHAHRWIWNIVMLAANMSDWMYKREIVPLRECIKGE